MQVLISTQNESYGFFGTSQSNYGLSVREAARLFNAVAQHMVASGFAPSADAARDFLDSRYGRHFADALSYRVSMPCCEWELLTVAAVAELADPKARRSWVRSLALAA